MPRSCLRTPAQCSANSSITARATAAACAVTADVPSCSADLTPSNAYIITGVMSLTVISQRHQIVYVLIAICLHVCLTDSSKPDGRLLADLPLMHVLYAGYNSFVTLFTGIQ